MTNSKPKIGIVGAGAMGSLFGWNLARSGHSVVLLDTNRETVDSINRNGLTIIQNSSEENIKLTATDNYLVLKDTDIIFLFIKSYSTEMAIKAIAESYSKESIIVSLQNGLGNIELISHYMPNSPLIFGSTTVGATKLNPNTVKAGGMGEIGRAHV